MLRGPSISKQVAPAPPLSRRRTSGGSAADLRRVLTHQRSQLRALRDEPQPRVTWQQALRAINHWGSWVLVVTLVVSQLACIFWNSQTSEEYMLYGQDPTKGPFHIDGYNDEPYSDRSLVCVREGRLYRPMQLSAALASPQAEIVDMTGTFITGYRIVPRAQISLEESVAERNVTYRVLDSLLVIILPYWDNAIFARYMIPGVDGSACSLCLSGLYDSATTEEAWVRAVNRTVRESRMAQWLGIHDSDDVVWKNGWLEDRTTGLRWYSAMLSTVQPSDDTYRIRERLFDVLSSREIDCVGQPLLCNPAPLPEWWGNQFYSTDTQLWYNSVAISNGTRFGLFLYEAKHMIMIHSVYDVAMLISNTTVGFLLFRRDFSTPGIGCLACARSFEMLPLILLPRMTSALAAFFTAGCRFEGEQRPISEAWFVIYPAIAEVMVYYYSVLNVVAEVLRRRVSDELFGPSLGLLCLLHYLRLSLARSGLFEFDGRIATAMTAAEYEKLGLVDLFTTNAALRMNGNVWSIFWFKLVVLAANLLPLLVARKAPPQPWAWDDAAQVATKTTAIERALGVRASDNPGLGVSSMWYHDEMPMLVRLGYFVFGDVVVIPVTDWLTIVLFSCLGTRTLVSNYRVLEFRVLLAAPPPATTPNNNSSCTVCRLQLDGQPLALYQINDPLLLGVSAWDIAAMPLP